MEIQSEITRQRKVFDGLKNDIARRQKANCLLELQEREMIRTAIRLQNELEDIRRSMRTEREVGQRKVEAETVQKIQGGSKEICESLKRLQIEKSTTQERRQEEQESSDGIPVELRDQKTVLESCLADPEIKRYQRGAEASRIIE
jgi:hypothetical protein